MLMYYLNSQYLKQITDSASFFYADQNLMAFVLILFTAFFQVIPNVAESE